MSRLVEGAPAAGFGNLANLSRGKHRILAAYFRRHTKVGQAPTRREVRGLMLFFQELDINLARNSWIYGTLLWNIVSSSIE